MALLDEIDERIPYYDYGFPVHGAAWERYIRGAHHPGATRGELAELREVADRLNREKDFARGDTKPARAGELVAWGLLCELFRYLLDHYAIHEQPGVLTRSVAHVAQHLGAEAPGRLCEVFTTYFPPGAVLAETTRLESWLEAAGAVLGQHELLSSEMLLLATFMENPALKPYRSLFDDEKLRENTRYVAQNKLIETYLNAQPPVAATGLPIIQMLRAPIEACPDSIEGQLEFVRTHWRRFLPTRLIEKLSIARSALREETMMRGLGPGPVETLRFGLTGGASGEPEIEAFSPDKAWMPNVVLIAKTVYVWLHQLSRQYERDIYRLDQIPDNELDKLRDWGFNGLWLIGIWERSPASRTIKRMMGNAEAEASAYSLFDYVIAADLGGESAYRDLAERAGRRGIRLASDMVPNHVGIDSKWVREHPDWFVASWHPPFPGYTFDGPDLSSEPGVGIYLEDGYWDHRDAAVVFKRVDHHSGETRFIYHGNDGTSMPWNDTAQLNYLVPEVREAVIQTILHVARHFPIIRFDAAMTLAKKHFQRLWFPLPGDGGAIPSRAEHSMTKDAFDAIFPKEFWRDVVDRVAAEVPDTLLLAEAFWLMEGYFVRTLGMHRVYNSAFMNMLKLEDNGKYRQTIKNVLEFSPEILQRFVNFMNNPDEDTAEAQFGKGDKYFGVAVLLATMPGLPMFGHGQIEGYREKYGMEYRRAYYDEWPEDWLVDRHRQEIFPLLRQRYLWSGARNFALFDLYRDDGGVDENVFAYANRAGRERGLVIYNNAYEPTAGTVRVSTALNEGSAEAPRLRQVNLAEALNLNTSETCYYILRDSKSGLEYLRHGRQMAEEGLKVSLSGYGYHIFNHWTEIHDFDHSWGRLHALLGGAGVPSVYEEYHELHLASVLEPFRQLVDPDIFSIALDRSATKAELKKLSVAYEAVVAAIGTRLQREVDGELLFAQFLELRSAVLNYTSNLVASPWPDEIRDWMAKKLDQLADEEAFHRIGIAFALIGPLGEIARPEQARGDFSPARTAGAWMREWFLSKQLAKTFEEMDGNSWRAVMDARLVRLALAHGADLFQLYDDVWGPLLHHLFEDWDVHAYLGIHHYNGRRWLNREQLANLLPIMVLLWSIDQLEDLEAAGAVAKATYSVDAIIAAASDTGYDLDWMLEAIR